MQRVDVRAQEKKQQKKQTNKQKNKNKNLNPNYNIKQAGLPVPESYWRKTVFISSTLDLYICLRLS